MKGFLSGLRWSVLGAVISQAIIVGSHTLLSKNLGAESYGRLILIQSGIGMISAAANIGLGTTAVRYISARREIDLDRLSKILTLSLRFILFMVGSFVVLGIVFYRTFSEFMFGSVESRWITGAILLGAGFSALDVYGKAILVGWQRYSAYAGTTILGALIGLPVMVGLSAAYNLRGAVIGFAIWQAIQASIGWIQVQRSMPEGTSFKASKSLDEWRVLKDFALPAFLSGALTSPTIWYCQRMLSEGVNGYQQLAVLGVGMQWFNIAMFIPSVSSRVILPMLSEQTSLKSRSGVRNVLSISLRTNAICVIIPVFLLMIFSPFIVTMYGLEKPSAATVVTICLSSSLITALISPVANLLIASHRMWIGALMNAGGAAVFLSLGYLLLGYGAMGIAIAMAVAYLFHAMWVTAWVIHSGMAKHE